MHSLKKFVDATGYITTTERKPDWSSLKKHYRNTPKPPDGVMVAASLIFKQTNRAVGLNDYITNGGHGLPGQTGNIRKAQTVPLHR